MQSLILACLSVGLSIGKMLYFDDFEDYKIIQQSPKWNYSFDPNVTTQQKPLNAEIIPCATMSDGSRNGNCMHLTKRDIGGGAFTAAIPYPQDGDKIFVEFQYYAINYKGKTDYSSLCVGYTNNIISGFVWSACGNTSMDFTQSSPSGQPIVQIIDGVDEWKIVRFQVDPIDKSLDYFETDPTLVIVFEDWLGVNERTQAPGLYLIDDIIVYQGNLCPTDCELCSNYFTCILCDPGKVYLNDLNMCFDDESCLQPFNINSTDQIDGSISKVDKDQYILNMAVDGYDFNGCFEVILESGDQQQLEIPFTVLANDSSRIAAPFRLGNDCDTVEEGYECLFTLSFYADNTRIFQRQIIFQIIRIVGGNTTNYSIQRSQKVNKSSTVQVPVKTEIAVCTYVQGQKSCDGVPQKTDFQRGDQFMITLTITDSQFTQYRLGEGYVQQLGQGTNFNFTIISTFPAQGQISYVVQADLVTDPTQVTVVTASLLTPTGRRLLETINGALPKQYQPSGAIAVTITSEQYAVQLAFFLFGMLLLI